MKIKLFNKQTAAAALLCFAATSCVEDTLDLSKDIDATIAIGNNISIPLGGTEKIMLTEMIKTEDSDVLTTDDNGNYVITKGGDIDETSVNIEEVDVTVKPMSHSTEFDLKIIAQTKAQIQELLAEVERVKQEAENTAATTAAEAKAEAAAAKATAEEEASNTKAEAKAEADKQYNDAIARIDASITDPTLNAQAKEEAREAYNEACATIENTYNDAIGTIATAYNDAIATIDEALQAANDEIAKQYNGVIEEYNKALESDIDLGEIDHEITGDASKISYNLSVDIPQEVKEIETVEFEEATDLTIDIAIAVKGEGNSDFSNLIETINLNGNHEGEKFYIGVPKFIIFEEGTAIAPAEGYNKLYIEGGATSTDNKNIKHLTRIFKIKGFDFTKDEGIKIENGKITIEKEFSAEGRIAANAINISLANALTITGVNLDATVSIGEKKANSEYSFTLKKIKGIFAPEIDPISIDDIELDLGEDMDFVYEDGAIFDFANPQIKLTINSGINLEAQATITLRSYDDNGTEITPAEGVQIPLTIKEGKNIYNIDNNFFTPGVPNLSTLLAKVPHTVKIEDVKPSIKEEVQEVTLGEDMTISGSYDINIPMVFNELNLTYTETVEDILGENADDITDYIDEIESISIEFDVLNTVPADFGIEVVAIDDYGRKIDGITAQLVDEEGNPTTIKAGNGHTEEPVTTAVKIKLSAAQGCIDELCDLDIKLNGTGNNVTLNENAYIMLENMSITIDKPIVVDMN